LFFIITDFIDTNKTYSYGEIEGYTQRLAHFCLKIGLKAGDTVAIFMDNKPGLTSLIPYPHNKTYTPRATGDVVVNIPHSLIFICTSRL